MTEELQAVADELNLRIMSARAKYPDGANIEALREEFFEAYDEHSELIACYHSNVKKKHLKERFICELIDVMTVCARLVHQTQESMRLDNARITEPGE